MSDEFRLIEQALQDHEGKLHKALRSRDDEIKSLQDMVRNLAQKQSAPFGPEVHGNRSPFDAFLRSPELTALRKGAPSTGRVELPNISIKALTSTQFAPGSPTVGYDVQPARDPGLYAYGRRSLRLLDVLTRMPIASNAFEYHRIDSYTNQAAVQASEGTQKQQTSVAPELQTAKVFTFAHWLPVSKQLLDDVPALQASLENLLRYGVADKIENAIINDTGGAEIDGLISAGTTFVHTNGADAADRISEASSHLESTGWSPSVVVMNPNDWHVLRTTKGSGDGQYMVGSWNMPASPQMWGLPVVPSAAMPATQAIVMDASQVLLLDRQSVQVMIGQDGNDFTSNRFTLLAEARAGLAVLSPAAVQIVDLFGSP